MTAKKGRVYSVTASTYWHQDPPHVSRPPLRAATSNEKITLQKLFRKEVVTLFYTAAICVADTFVCPVSRVIEVKSSL